MVCYRRNIYSILRLTGSGSIDNAQDVLVVVDMIYWVTSFFMAFPWIECSDLFCQGSPRSQAISH